MLKKLLLIAVLPIALAACKDQEKKASPAAEEVTVNEAPAPTETEAKPVKAEPVIDPNAPSPPAKANTLERKKAFSGMYDCKEATIKTDFDGKGNVTVLAAGKQSKLSLVNHQKGQRYETAADSKPYVILWDMDKEAIIEVDGREWMKCTQMSAE